MMVLANFEPVPFYFTRVSDPEAYPALTDLPLDQTDALTRSVDTTFGDGEPFQFTLAVPPSSFEDGVGVYDLRVIFVPKPTPRDDTGFFQAQNGIPGTAFRVYYGGCNSIEPQISEATSTIETMWTRTTTALVGRADGVFLAPTQDVYPWRDIEDPREVRLRDASPLPEQAFTLELYSRLRKYQLENFAFDREVVYLILRDTEIIDTFRWTPPVYDTSNRSYFATEEERPVVKLKLPKPPEGTNYYTVMAFPNPYGIPVADKTARVMASNTLIFE